MVRFYGPVPGKKGLYISTVLLSFIAVAAFALIETADAELSSPADNEPGHQSEVLAGTATVEVVTEPVLCNGGRLRFTGVPSGEIVLGGCEDGEPAAARTLSAPNLPVGQRTTTLSFIDPSIVEAGYSLVAIRCDDRESQTRSLGDVANKRATFRVDTNESVKCTFVLSTMTSSCICPKNGRWTVKNHLGRMACTGSFSFAHPLPPVTVNGTITPNEDCSTLYAEGMSADEASITFRRTASCGYKGTIGGQQGGIPMEIHFTLDVVNEERMTGALTSTVNERGATCNMNRTYEMDFRGQ